MNIRNIFSHIFWYNGRPHSKYENPSWKAVLSRRIKNVLAEFRAESALQIPFRTLCCYLGYKTSLSPTPTIDPPLPSWNLWTMLQKQRQKERAKRKKRRKREKKKKANTSICEFAFKMVACKLEFLTEWKGGRVMETISILRFLYYCFGILPGIKKKRLTSQS